MWKKCGRQKNNDCTLVRGVELYTPCMQHKIIKSFLNMHPIHIKKILLKLLIKMVSCVHIFLFHKVCNKLRGVYYLRKRRENESLFM